MGRRAARPTWEEKDRRGHDRRQVTRRKSDTLRTWLRFVVIAIVAAVLARYIHW